MKYRPIWLLLFGFGLVDGKPLTNSTSREQVSESVTIDSPSVSLYYSPKGLQNEKTKPIIHPYYPPESSDTPIAATEEEESGQPTRATLPLGNSTDNTEFTIGYMPLENSALTLQVSMVGAAAYVLTSWWL